MLPITALVLLCCFRPAMSIAGREPSLSASAIVAPAVSGSHVLSIHGYSLTKGLGNGKYIASEAFAVGGHRWRLLYYPDSLDLNDSEWISVMMHCDHTGDLDEVKAKFTISLLDKDGNPVPSYSKTSPLCSFSGSQSLQCLATGYDLIKRSELEGSVYLKGDRFSVRCDVTVAKEIFTKAIPVADRRKRLTISPTTGCLVLACVLFLSVIVVLLSEQ